MKNRLVYAFVVLLASVTLIGAGAAPDDAAAEQMQEINRAQDYIPNQVDLYLPSNPTTGYSWEVQVEEEDVVAIRDQFFEDSNELGLVGVGGTHWFHISGLKPGTTSVRFRYARPWETDGNGDCTLYRLTVNDQLDVMIWGVEVS